MLQSNTATGSCPVYGAHHEAACIIYLPNNKQTLPQICTDTLTEAQVHCWLGLGFRQQKKQAKRTEFAVALPGMPGTKGAAHDTLHSLRTPRQPSVLLAAAAAAALQMGSTYSCLPARLLPEDVYALQGVHRPCTYQLPLPLLLPSLSWVAGTAQPACALSCGTLQAAV